jgi:hypothetical protein
LKPAIAARLAAGEGAAASHLALATLFELAQRGVIRIEETPRRLFSGRDFTVLRVEDGGSLTGFETVLFAALFETRKGPRTSRRMTEFGEAFAYHSGRFTDALRREMASLGLVDLNRYARRRSILVASGLLFGGTVLAAVLGLVAAPRAGTERIAAACLGIAAGAFVVAIASVISGYSVSSLTEQGEVVAAGWRGFAAYLKDVTKGREPGPGREVVHEWLRYAAGFGLAESWTKHFKRQGISEAPEWFRAFETADGGDVGAMVALMSASSSAADGGAGGCDGGAGGGASGAG